MSNFLSYKSLYDPYETTASKFTAIQPVRIELAKLEATGVDKTYGVDFGCDIEPFIIIGKEKEEEAIGPFELPLIFMTGRGKYSIGIDLREYVNNTVRSKPVESYSDLLSVMPRHDAANTLFRMGSIMAALLNGEIGKIPKDDFIVLYSSYYASIISGMIKLEPDDELFCKVILSLWAYIMCSDIDYNEIDVNMVLRMIATKLKLSTNPKTLDWMRNSVLKVNMTINNLTKDEDRKLKGLCRVFQEALVPEVSKFFSVNVFSNQLSNAWFGPGKVEASRGAMECIPVFLALCESSLGLTTYKTSRMSQILNKNSRVINKNDFLKKMERNFPFRP